MDGHAWEHKHKGYFQGTTILSTKPNSNRRIIEESTLFDKNNVVNTPVKLSRSWL